MIDGGSLGKRIKRRRLELELNLRQLAERTGVTASFLSQVEHGKVNVSLNTLQTLSEVLAVPLLYFLQDVDQQEAKIAPVEKDASTTDETPRAYMPVVHSDARPQMFFPFSGVSYEMLVPGFGQKMVAFLCKFSPGAGNVVRKLREPTEEFMYVLSGELQVGLVTGEYTLKAGDTIYFEGKDLQKILCTSEEEVVWISVITPPVF